MIKTIDVEPIRIALEILLEKRNLIQPAVGLPIADVERLELVLKILEQAQAVPDDTRKMVLELCRNVMQNIAS